ncbi:MAG TPA: hypothetical protein VMW52_13670 [Phycisphaerae bacterium]|nr:hypothetical protein [Phycisphaerae bacterium]
MARDLKHLMAVAEGREAPDRPAARSPAKDKAASLPGGGAIAGLTGWGGLLAILGGVAFVNGETISGLMAVIGGLVILGLAAIINVLREICRRLE